jgi:hypothetical protein
MTPENLESRWIHFEAGAVAKTPGDSHVTALLLNVQEKDVVDPLAQFQHTMATREDVWKLALAVNGAVEPTHQTPGDVLQWSFEKAWPDFESLVQSTRDALQALAVPPPRERSPQDMLEEVLGLLREQQRERFESSHLGRFAPVLTPEQMTSVFSSAKEGTSFRTLLGMDNTGEMPLTLRQPPQNDTK